MKIPEPNIMPRIIAHPSNKPSSFFIVFFSLLGGFLSLPDASHEDVGDWTSSMIVSVGLFNSNTFGIFNCFASLSYLFTYVLTERDFINYYLILFNWLDWKIINKSGEKLFLNLLNCYVYENQIWIMDSCLSNTQLKLMSLSFSLFYLTKKLFSSLLRWRKFSCFLNQLLSAHVKSLHAIF